MNTCRRLWTISPLSKHEKVSDISPFTNYWMRIFLTSECAEKLWVKVFFHLSILEIHVNSSTWKESIVLWLFNFMYLIQIIAIGRTNRSDRNGLVLFLIVLHGKNVEYGVNFRFYLRIQGFFLFSCVIEKRSSQASPGFNHVTI